MVLIRYNLGINIMTSAVIESDVEFIENLKKIGATRIETYKLQTCCDAGLVVVDADGVEEPCPRCSLGMAYKKKFFTPATTSSKAAAYEPDEIPF